MSSDRVNSTLTFQQGHGAIGSPGLISAFIHQQLRLLLPALEWNLLDPSQTQLPLLCSPSQPSHGALWCSGHKPEVCEVIPRLVPNMTPCTWNALGKCGLKKEMDG